MAASAKDLVKLYFWVDEKAATVNVVCAWGGKRGHEPKLQAHPSWPPKTRLPARVRVGTRALASAKSG